MKIVISRGNMKLTLVYMLMVSLCICGHCVTIFFLKENLNKNIIALCFAIFQVQSEQDILLVEAQESLQQMVRPISVLVVM